MRQICISQSNILYIIFKFAEYRAQIISGKVAVIYFFNCFNLFNKFSPYPAAVSKH